MKSMRLSLLVFLSASLFTACASVSRRDADRAALHLQIGTGHLSHGNYPQALVELQKANELDPKNPVILNNLGLAYYVRGRLPQAETFFRSAIGCDSNFSEAKNNLGRALIDQGKLNEALQVLQAVEGDLTYSFPEKTYSNLGMAYFEKGDFKKAEQYLSKSLRIRRQSCTTANYYGRTLLELKQVAQSAETLDQAIEFCREAKFEEPLYFSAMSYFTLGDKEKARSRLDELLTNYPKSKYVAKAKGMLELLDQ